MDFVKHKMPFLILSFLTLFSYMSVKAEGTSKTTESEKNKLTVEMATNIASTGSGKISFKLTKEGTFKDSSISLNSALSLKEKLINLKQSASGDKKIETAEIKFNNLKELNSIMPKDSDNKNIMNLEIKETGRGILSNSYSYEMNLKADYLGSVLNVKQLNQGDNVILSSVVSFPDNVNFVNTGLNDNKVVKWQYSNDELKNKITMIGKYDVYNRIILYGASACVLIIVVILVVFSVKKA